MVTGFVKLTAHCLAATAFIQQATATAVPRDASLGNPQQLNVDNIAAAAINAPTCNAEQLQKIQAAIPVAQAYIDNTYDYMHQFDPVGGAPANPNDPVLARFTRWFGAYSQGHWTDIRRRATALKNNAEFNLNNANGVGIRYNCHNLDHCGGIMGKVAVQAYVYHRGAADGVKEINLCPAFFSAPYYSPEAAATTLVHELAHFDIAWLDGANKNTMEVYTSPLSWALARLSYDRAVQNADNYAWFARNPGMCRGDCPIL
ncbi:hypothetical protein ONZ45_g16899 [Pleurotus djamor]|nr:hypothetical protein ONZ45_g16899 [Pleurotus djamor]